MGPRLFSHGNDEKGDIDEINESSFNGATTFQPWKFAQLMMMLP